ncbi:MAG: acyltransferase domain-containing protein [Bacteroidales bacterium]|nr:acyltransferase domain-containing protein [Bacteroidales bacterium]
MINENNYQGTEIAIIGISGRFPFSDSVWEFWKNLTEGKECVKFFGEQELLASGVNQSEINNPNYVRAKAQINGAEMFDASFFGYIPREAEFTDPQHRIFLECAWEAIENAGHDPEKYNGLIGVFAGAGLNSYYFDHILNHKKQVALLGNYHTWVSNLNDILCPRVSYKLNLKGPSFTVQAACSTSLVSVHLACQSLLLRECDMALAGGTKIILPRNVGYLYSEGGITSPDGHCRAFDSQAAGMLPGEGVGIVVLKRLEDALSDNDHIYAIIRGSAINNDGSLKVGFTAPSIDGQSKVITEAQSLAGTESGTITYIEAHGTGTQLGDPVEIRALSQAFGTDKRNYCAIGSVKTNIGHLDTAAGIAGLIKTVLMLYHKKFVPSLHFVKPNPSISIENSPFFVNTQYRDWEVDGSPRRAGVNSFGIGGTNAHVILEEAPQTSPSPARRRCKLLLLSAKTSTALESATNNLITHIKERPNVDLSDAAYTLQVGRRHFKYRKICVCTDADEAINAFVNEDKIYTVKTEDVGSYLVFMFSGQGSQYINMAYDLYQNEPFFKQKVDECLSKITPYFNFDIKSILFSKEGDSKKINQTELAQPLIFTIEYALVQLLIKWGVKPNAMIGHSIGEYVAACISGVFTLDEALRLVILRGKLMQEVQPGAMIGVALPEEQLLPFISEQVSLAAVNTNGSCVLSGAYEAIDKLLSQFDEKNITYRRLETSHAFHSAMMEPILERLEAEIRKVQLNEPSIPYISNISGKWITKEQVKDPKYWSKHLRGTVRFYDGLETLSRNDNVVYIEVGPGKVLSTFVNQLKNQNNNPRVINLLRHPNENVSDDYYLTTKIGQLWLQGIEINWESYHSEEKRNRIPLPTYPFERKKYWVEASQKDGKEDVTLSKKQDISDWFYTPSWEQSTFNDQENFQTSQDIQWLIFTKDNKCCEQIIKYLEKNNQKVKTVLAGSGFKQVNDNLYFVNPAIEDDYSKLFQILKVAGTTPDRILHLWNVGDDEEKELIDQIEATQNNGLYSLLNIARSIGFHSINKNVKLDVITSNTHSITGEEEINPLKATLIGAIKIIPLEYLNISCRNIDVSWPSTNSKSEEKLASQIYDEIRNENLFNNIVGYRGYYRWVLNYKALRLETAAKSATTIRQGGVYLITGGFGGMGIAIAEHLAKEYKAKLVLVGRKSFPQRTEWDRYIEASGADDPTSIRILKVRELEQYSSQVRVCSADVSDYGQMHQVIQTVEKEFGCINGVFHTAGLADYFGIIQRRSKEQTDEIMAPKVKGTFVIDSLVNNKDLDFFLCFSSLGNQVYQEKFGQVGYNAANEFLDAFSLSKKSNKATVYKTINWADWLQGGMAIEAVKRKRKNENNIDFASILSNAVTPSEGIGILYRVLNSRASQLIVSKIDLHSLIEEKSRRHLEKINGKETQEDKAVSQLKSRPELSTTYKNPETECEKKLIKNFEEFFGYEHIGVNDDFFELGGDSLKARSLISKVHKEFDVKISMPELFNNPTIIKLAKLIENSNLNVYASIKKAPEQKYYPVSSAQKRLFILQQFDEDDIAYNVADIFWLNGKIDYNRLEQAIKQIIKKHEAFRTSFLFKENVLVQKVEDNIDFSIEHLEVGLEDPSSVILQFIKPFNLSKAPLLQVKLCKVKEDKHLIIINIHHIICDGISWGIFMKDLGKAYLNEEIGNLRIQYTDYTVWEQSNINDKILKAQESYWLSKFNDKIPVLNIYTDYPRPETQSFEGDSCRFELSEDMSRSLNALCEKYNVTLYMMLFSLYNILLSKYSNSEDIIVGTVNAGREHDDLKDIIGMFVNTLALRSKPVGSKKFTDYLNEVKSAILGAFENQYYPFEELIDKLKLSRNLNRNPLFDTMFVLQNYESEKLQIGELTVEKYEINSNKCLFDISLIAFERDTKIFYILGYRKKLFKPDTIKRFGNHLNDIAKQIIENPESLLSEIEVIAPEKFKQIVHQRNGSDKVADDNINWKF